MIDWIGLSPASFTIVAVMTFGAAFVRGFTGFGMAIILVPLLGLVIAPEQAVVLALILQLLIGPVGIRGVVAHCERASVAPISLLAMLTTPVGLLILGITPQDLARTAIAFIAIGAFVLVLLPSAATAQRPGRAGIALTGLSSGLLAGFAGMPGPPVIPYYLRRGLTPRMARASMILVFFATAIAGTITAIVQHLATLQLALLSAALFLPMLAGNWLGAQFFGRIPAHVWRAGVGLVLGIAALFAFYRMVS